MKDVLALLLVFLFVGGLTAFVFFLLWYEPWLLLLFVGLPAALVSFAWAAERLDRIDGRMRYEKIKPRNVWAVENGE